MWNTNRVLDEIRRQIAADKTVLDETRERRDLVLGIALQYAGALRTFTSGSVAHRTVNHPVVDADGGVVLDRRSYPDLGPDSKKKLGPSEIVPAMCQYIKTEVTKTYYKAGCKTTKRAILTTISEPMVTSEHPDEAQDPSVDLIVALTRANSAPGLWIPNLEADCWDASDPEKHTALLNSGSAGLQRTRRRAVRLAKAENGQHDPPAVSSFNLEALGLAAVKEGMSLAKALLALWSEGARQFAVGLTKDPADVSAPIKVKDLQLAQRRMQAAATALTEALAQDDDEDAVREALSRVFFDFISSPVGNNSKAALADSLRRNDGRASVTGLGLGLGPAVAPLKSTRAYGATPHR